MKLIHFTDTHFVPRGETLYGRDPRAALEAAITDINRNHADADLAVVTGDLTHWGEPEAFASLAEVLSKLDLPLQMLIGNHDARGTFTEYFPDQPLDDNGFVQSIRRSNQGRLIFLDTNEPGSHAGWFCDTRRQWLARELDMASDEPVFLFMHHPPCKTGLAPLDRISLQDTDAFAAVIEPHRHRIRHIFFGHIHRPLSGSWRGIPISSLRSMNHQSWLDFTADKHIKGSFEPPAYAVALIDTDSVIIHTHDFLDDSPKFDLHNSPVDDWATRFEHP